MLRVGLTGGIACGKSRVLAVLAGQGLPVLDLDRVAHAVMEPGGPAYADVVAAFGPGILDESGTVDRKALGAIVFADPLARERLNALVHPRVREVAAAAAHTWAAEGAAVGITDAALLVESGVHLRYDRLVVVHCAPEQQLSRLMARDGIGEAQAQARLAAQMPIGEKRQFAHLEVDTSGSLADTDAGALQLAERLQAMGADLSPRVPAPRSTRSLGGTEGPRGLTPQKLLAAAERAGSLDMAALAALVEPPLAGPWYATPPNESLPGPETLAGAVASWALERRGADAEFVASAMASVARLTHGRGPAAAGAVLLALSWLRGDRVETSLQLARRWGGGEPTAAAPGQRD